MRRALWSKLIISFIVVLLIIYLFLYSKSGSKLQKSYFLNTTQFRTRTRFISSTPRTAYNHDTKIVVSFVVCGQRLEEALNVVKSALIFTRSPLYFVIFSDDKLQPIVNNTLMEWKKLRDFQFELHQINFPKSHQADWMNLFSKCAAQRLFYPDLLKDIDSLIYVDIDTLFLGPVEELWGQFNEFKSKQMVGLVLENSNPNLSWYPRFAQHPFYGETGLNSGVMLMNLSKMRKFSWVDYVTPIMLKYKLFIPWGDQDIINIILHTHPEVVYEMSCRYNFRPDLCMYGEGCPEATSSGIHLLHGSRSAFQNDNQPIFKAIYKAINEFNLETSDINALVLNMNNYVNETPKSTCGLQRYPKLLGELDREFQRVVPPELTSSDENRNRNITHKIRTFYFQNRPVDARNIDSLIDLFTDVMFLRPVLETLRLQANTNRTSPTYLYRFAFDGALGLFKRMLGITHPGVCHGDEMGYLFHFSRLNYRLDDDSPELAVSKKMIRLWTNFAKTGNPTPPVEYESVIDFEWPPVNETSHLPYLDISGNFTIKEDPEKVRVRFWDWLYENYADKM